MLGFFSRSICPCTNGDGILIIVELRLMGCTSNMVSVVALDAAVAKLSKSRALQSNNIDDRKPAGWLSKADRTGFRHKFLPLALLCADCGFRD